LRRAVAPAVCPCVRPSDLMCLKFLKKIDRETLPNLDLHLIADNFSDRIKAMTSA
jgi:hypothetical protein